jgi:hypothetical protein
MSREAWPHPSGRPIRERTIKPMIERAGRRVLPIVERLADCATEERAGGVGFLMPRADIEWTDTIARGRNELR